MILIRDRRKGEPDLLVKAKNLFKQTHGSVKPTTY
jgi:hypothetical protein